MPRRMTRREALRRIAGAGAGLALGWQGAGRALRAGQRADGRPNVLFILTDDQRWDLMGCAGHPIVRTPNMDRIAAEGARFTNAFVTTSLCSPSRASFLTGLYAHCHGVRRNDQMDLSADTPTFPRLLQAAGYDTAFIGKWHMAPTADPRPGFDYWLSFVGQGEYKDPDLNENGTSFKASGYMTDLLTDYAVRWLRRPRTRPFCMILSHKAIHGPFQPAQRHAGLYADARMPKPPNFDDTFEGKPEWLRASMIRGGRRAEWLANRDKPVPPAIPPVPWQERNEGRLNYMRTLAAVDEGIGRVLGALEEAGVLDDTVVIFAGDNGFFLGEHRRGDKRLIYEESIRIPLLMRYPRLAKPGALVEGMALNLDVAPTVLDLAGAEAPSAVQGRSLRPLLEGSAGSWRTSFLYEYFQEGWLPGIPTMLGVRTDRWKYVRYPEIEDLDELYDLSADPHELRNLAADPDSRQHLEAMRAELERLLEETGYGEEHRPKVVRPAEMVLWYRFDEAGGDRVADASGLGNHGVSRGAARAALSGRTAVRLDGREWIEVPNAPSLDPSRGPWSVAAWVRSERENGVVLARGGESHGYSLYLEDGLPRLAARITGSVFVAAGPQPVIGRWTHLAGVLTGDYRLCLYVNGERRAACPVDYFIGADPNEPMQIGGDDGTPVADYEPPMRFVGEIAEVRVFRGELTAEQVRSHAGTAGKR